MFSFSSSPFLYFSVLIILAVNITLNHKLRSIDVTMKNEKKSSQVLSPKPQHCPLYFEIEVSLGSPVIDIIIYFPLKHSGEMGIYLNMVSLLKKKKVRLYVIMHGVLSNKYCFRTKG